MVKGGLRELSLKLSDRDGRDHVPMGLGIAPRKLLTMSVPYFVVQRAPFI